MSTNVTPLKQLFAAKHDFVPTTKMARDIARWRTLFETRGEHPEVLNTPLLAVNKMRFRRSVRHPRYKRVGVHGDD